MKWQLFFYFYFIAVRSSKIVILDLVNISAAGEIQRLQYFCSSSLFSLMGLGFCAKVGMWYSATSSTRISTPVWSLTGKLFEMVFLFSVYLFFAFYKKFKEFSLGWTNSGNKMYSEWYCGLVPVCRYFTTFLPELYLQIPVKWVNLFFSCLQHSLVLSKPILMDWFAVEVVTIVALQFLEHFILF